MEIGSFIEMEFRTGEEYYSLEENIARLNTGRAAIWHALRVLGLDTIWLPFYQCDTVREFLKKKDISLKYYHIDRSFNPIDLKQGKDEAVLLVNYYGVMSFNRMQELVINKTNVIVDNSQAFFCKPLENCMNVYSPRKFIGVPDGSYLIGKNAHKFVDEYRQCYSSDTALFLLQRIEYGCEGRAYENRQANEHRINTEDCMKMSLLTRRILCGSDYDFNLSKRKENFQIACRLFDSKNCISATSYFDDTCCPMVYPLVLEDDKVLERLQKAKHYQGHWWGYLLNEMKENDFEYWISRYIIPITIDQRYGENELKHLHSIINS